MENAFEFGGVNQNSLSSGAGRVSYPILSGDHELSFDLQ